MKKLFTVLLGLTLLFGYAYVVAPPPIHKAAHVNWAQVSISVPPITTTTATIQERMVRKRASRGACGDCIDAHLWRIFNCESHGNPQSVSKSGKYRGGWQFSMATWEGAGGHEFAIDPIDATIEQQFIIAKRIYLRSGSGQWPICQRR